MAKINFANTAKLGFWDFVIDFTTPEPKLISGDYKDLRAKIEAGELIDGVAVLQSQKIDGIGFGYERLSGWMVEDGEDDPGIALEFDESSYIIKENNTVEFINNPKPSDLGDLPNL